MKMASIVITKDAAKRIIKDIKQIKNEPVEGIYYIHDEVDMLRGKALIIGPPDSVYNGGYYFFCFTFPPDYPHSPPIVQFHTNDGITRMHPNLYKNGKVCLSILNTWNGEAWTGCQTITSVLITLRSIMTNDPLQHEPGVDQTHIDYHTYNEIIRYKNFSLAMLDVVKKDSYLKFGELLNIAKTDFINNYKIKRELLEECITLFNRSKLRQQRVIPHVQVILYNMICKIDYKELEDNFHVTYCKLSSNNPKK